MAKRKTKAVTRTSKKSSLLLAKDDFIPDFVSDKAKSVYQELVTRLKERKVYDELDSGKLIRYAETFVLWFSAHDFVLKHGCKYEVLDREGNSTWRAYPEVSASQKWSTQLHQMEQELGMSAKARANIIAAMGGGGKPPKKRDRFAVDV